MHLRAWESDFADAELRSAASAKCAFYGFQGSPTRAALLTGRHEFRNGLTHTIHERERLVPGAVMLAQTLRGVGVRRGFLESGTSGNEPAYGPSARGFQEMFIHGAGDRADDPGSCGDAPGSTYFHPAEAHRQVVEVLGAAYEKWWAEVEPQLVDEGVKVPAVNPFREP